MATVFTAAWPSSYHCSLAEGHHKNQSIPVEEYDENGEPVFDSCHMYVNSSVDNTTTQCTDGWDYQAEFQETIVTQWDLVCDQTALSQISQSIYMIGVMIGALVVGRLSDRSGRKTMYLACLWSLGIFGTLTALTQTFAAYCILKFFIGLVQPGGATFIGLKVIVMLLGKFSISAGYGTVYVWTPEIYPTLLRNFGFSFCEFCASIGGVVAPLTVIVAYNNIVIPFMIFGSLSLVAGFLVLLLPETKDKVMPRTIEEAENLAKSSLTVDHRANEGAVASARKYHDVVTQTEWDSDLERERANPGI
ncbi:organic anion transporter 3-like [Ptychodera flava]|uniref:organic anion transporter 3-like n=1 Tax=Ptychodera flava TaxID=63121 RepID=UPI00396AB0EF